MTSSSSAPGRLARTLRGLQDLVASMRFAVSLLVVICLASVIGTVIKQGEPAVNYVNQFGAFWAEVFSVLGLPNVYSAKWFLLLMAVLLWSTTLCLLRNTPKFLRDMRQFKESVRASSLLAFPNRAEGHRAEPSSTLFDWVSQRLVADGWRAKAQVREDGRMVAAKRGQANKLGYIATHLAIVLICVGGLLDGNLVVKLRMLVQDKTPFNGGGLVSQVPAQHRLDEGTLGYRANIRVPEHATTGTAILSMPDGVVLQELPFSIELKQFKVEYYATGMPKLFASDVVLQDRHTGEKVAATIKVNEPFRYKGVNIFQSSFEDGGSLLTVKAWPMGTSGGQPFDIQGRVQEDTVLEAGSQKLKLEFVDLRPTNVEDFAPASAASAASEPAGWSNVQQHLGSGAKGGRQSHLRNVGPSFTYRLRDDANQAKEFRQYMQPVDIDGQRLYLAGMRESLSEDFRYLRIPADDQDSVAGWMRLNRALHDASMREKAVERMMAKAAREPSPMQRVFQDPELSRGVKEQALRTLALFAGVGLDARMDKEIKGGLPAVTAMLEQTVPAEQRNGVSDFILSLLSRSMVELHQMARAQDGLPAQEDSPAFERFMVQSMLSLSDAAYYPAPVMLTLEGFDQVQASVFQVTRAPGQWLVYIGFLMLCVGVLMMFYVRERRLWIWLGDQPGGGTHVRMAMSSSRRTMALDQEFEALRRELLPDVDADADADASAAAPQDTATSPSEHKSGTSSPQDPV